MPHTGKPSGACKTCKQRHVRCDEARPSCNRCTKSNRVCPGYSEGLDLVLRDQNEIAKAGVGRRQKAAQRARLASDNSQIRSRSISHHSDSSNSSSSSSEGSTALVLSPSYLTPSEEDYQLCLFVDTYALFPHDVQTDRGFIELLPLMYPTAKLDSSLVLCVAAISSVISAKFVLKMRDVEMPKVRQKYTKALTATRRALEDPVESLTDETLMAVCLLGYYEAAVESFSGRVSSARHFEGAAALIKQRQGRVTTELAQKILDGVRNSIIFRALTHTTPIDTTSPIWQKDGSTPHNAATLLDDMSVEIPNLMVAASLVASRDQESPFFTFFQETEGHSKVTVLTNALAIDAKLSTWPTAIPPTWTPARVSIEDIPESIIANGLVYQDYCEVYHDIMVCSTWNSYRLARLKALAVIIQLSSPSSSERHSAVETLQKLADDICASVPFCLGSRVGPAPLYSMEAEYPTIDKAPAKESHHRTAAAFGGWYIHGPMKEVMAVGKWLRPGQIAWMGTQLARLARIYDVKLEETLDVGKCA